MDKVSRRIDAPENMSNGGNRKVSNGLDIGIVSMKSG